MSHGTWNLWNRWDLVLLNVTFFSIFILLIPFRKKIERYPASVYLAFLIALFAEMYGFPLTIYFLSFFIGLPPTYEEGHLLGSFGAFIGNVILVIGAFLVIGGWKRLYSACRLNGKNLVTGGIYGYIRHPQYLGILLLTLGMLIHWPTFINAVMWPILVVLYYRLAEKEEKEMEEIFGKKFQHYKHRVPMFIPNLSSFYQVGRRGRK